MTLAVSDNSCKCFFKNEDMVIGLTKKNVLSLIKHHTEMPLETFYENYSNVLYTKANKSIPILLRIIDIPVYGRNFFLVYVKRFGLQ